MQNCSPDRWLRPKQIIRGGSVEKLPIAQSTLWLWVSQGRLPKPTKLGPRTSAWRESVLDQAIASLGN